MATVREREERMIGSMRALRGIGYGILGTLLLLSACTDGAGLSGEGGGGPRVELAKSKLVAPLAGAYKVRPNGSRVPPRQGELPVPVGAVEAHWYRSDGFYVVAFRGLDLQQSGPVCPGSSIQTAAGFEHVTNAPTKESACEGATSLASPGAGVRTCGPLVFYLTEIPESAKGALFASVEVYKGSRITGVTGVIEADRSAAPEIDAAAGGYALPEGLVRGETEVTC
jgi:hypothetical protein